MKKKLLLLFAVLAMAVSAKLGVKRQNNWKPHPSGAKRPGWGCDQRRRNTRRRCGIIYTLRK